MKKNVVFMACVVNKDRVKKYGNFDYYEYGQINNAKTGDIHSYF